MIDGDRRVSQRRGQFGGQHGEIHRPARLMVDHCHLESFVSKRHGRTLPAASIQARRARVAVEDTVASPGRAGISNVVIPMSSFIAAS